LEEGRGKVPRLGVLDATEQTKMRSDVTVIGGGIIGTAIARELSRYNLRITLIEKAVDIAFGGSTKANTGIVHAGYDDLPGTLKAQLCVKGNGLWPKIARELAVPFERTGSLVIALSEEAIPSLLELEGRGKKNEVLHLELIDDKGKLLDMEANLTEKVVAALYAPTAGMTSPYEMAVALAENARQNGVQILLNTSVKKVIVKEEAVTGIQTSEGLLEADYIINSAGLASNEISAMAGIDNFLLTPIKGEYHVFDKRLSSLVKHVLFPVPTSISKGIVVTQTVSGNLLIGPNANIVDDKSDLATTKNGLDEVFQGACNLIPELSSMRSMIIANFAGLRAESSLDDFIIKAYDEPRGFINVAGIKSPGLTAAPAIAEMVTHLLEEKGLKLKRKKNFKLHRKPIPRTIDEISSNRIGTLLAKDPRYGHMVCRCEHVSEGEIVEAVKRGADTLDGIKFRTRAGMGRCQGGFCTPHLLRILSREFGVMTEDVTKRGGRSHILPCKAKVLLKREGS
jgi:glycerol-3-phosphate dehydrogenase